MSLIYSTSSITLFYYFFNSWRLNLTAPLIHNTAILGRASSPQGLPLLLIKMGREEEANLSSLQN